MAGAWRNRADRGAERCVTCDSTCAREAAPFERQVLEPSPRCELERVHTPGATTIQARAETLGVGSERTLKALFLSTEGGELIFAVVRGDLDVSLVKLGSVVELDPTPTGIGSSDHHLWCGAWLGQSDRHGCGGAQLERKAYGSSPIRRSSAGPTSPPVRMRPTYYFIHVDPRRDFAITLEADIALAPSGARCATCGSRLTEHGGTILGPLVTFTRTAFRGGERRRGTRRGGMVDGRSVGSP